jgi:hypothetical protein
MNRADATLGTIDVAIHYAGSDSGRMAKAALQFALRELAQLRELHAPFAVTPDEFGRAWVDTHNREHEAETLEQLNAVLAARGR